MAFEIIADMAELADALDSGSSSRKGVEVRLLLSALFSTSSYVPMGNADNDFGTGIWRN